MNSLLHRPSASRQVIANIIGRAWVLFSNFIFLPVYLYVLGALNFGVVALFMAFTSLTAFLDLGLTPTLARELNDQRHSPGQKQDLLYSYELLFATFLGLVTLVVVALPINAFEWLVSARDFARPEIRETLRLVILASIAQLWLNFYVSSLFGIEQQVNANVLLVVAGLVRSAFVIVPLWIWPSPNLFLWWQLIAALGFALVARAILRRHLEISRKSRASVFDSRFIMREWRFSGALFLISITAAVNTQIDKVFIGRWQGLEVLSAYSLVITFVQLLVFVVTPVTLMLTPRLVRKFSNGDIKGVNDLFQLAHRVVAALICSGAGLMICFGPYLVSVWSGKQIVADTVSSYMPMLVIGYSLLGIATVPHCIALARKNMRPSLCVASSVLLTVPSFWITISSFGPRGAAATWLILQSIVVPFYYWIVLREAALKNTICSLFAPIVKSLIATGLVCIPASLVAGDPSEVMRNIFVIIVSAVFCVALSLSFALNASEWRNLLKFSR